MIENDILEKLKKANSPNWTSKDTEIALNAATEYFESKSFSLESSFNDIVMSYIIEFEEKHTITFDFFVGKNVGQVAMFGDYYIDFDDIRLDIDKNVNESLFFEWYDGTTSRALEEKPTVNYESYVMGFRYE